MSLALTTGIQEALVAILLFDPVGCTRAAGLVPHGAYDAHYRDLAREAVEYLEKYGKPAGEHALDLVESLKTRRADSANIYQRIYESLLATRDGINREYVFAQAGKFAKGQRIRDGLSKAMDALERDDASGVDEAEVALQTALTGSYDTFDAGGKFSDPERSLAFLTNPRTAFPTGIPALDIGALGPARKELHVLAADTGVGKSWWLVHLAKVALSQRLRVLYITLELSERDVFQRMAMCFFSYTLKKEAVTRRQIVKDGDGGVRAFKTQILSDRPALSDEDIHPRLLKKLRGFGQRPPLWVKEFPAGTLSIRGLRGYLSSLESAEGFIPDLILFDYPDEMDHDPANKRLELIKIFTDLRGIASERNVAVATVTQLNAEGAKVRLATKQHLSEARAKAQKVDVLLTVSQSPEEYEMGLARIFVAKGRAARDKFTVLVSQSLATGQFVVDSARMSETYEAMMRAKENEAKAEDRKRKEQDDAD